MNGDEKRVIDGVVPSEIKRIAVSAARIPSFPPPLGNEQELALFFAEELRKLGGEVEMQLVENSRPNVIARFAGTGDDNGKSVLFNGHIDTSPPCLGWTRDPFGGIVEGDTLFGHGISNMKASDTAMIGAIAALQETGTELAGEVLVSLVMGECMGGTGTKFMVNEGISADYFINGEPTDLNVLTLQAGVCRLKIVVVGRTHHHGTVGKGINAIEKLIRVIGGLGESLSPIKWIRSPGNKPEYEGLPRFNLGVFRGGLTEEVHEWGAYMVPDYAAATLDIRYQPGLTPEIIKRELESRIREISENDPEIDASVELQVEWSMPPYESASDDPVVSIMTESMSQVRSAQPSVGALTPTKFMAADAGLLQESGIPGVMCGVGKYTSSVPDECVQVSEIVDLAKSYALAALRATRPL